MEINRDNYEEYFLDFAEGNLTAEQEDILNNFLKFNPDLEAELKEFDLLQIPAEKITMPSRENLKREIPSKQDAVGPYNFELYSVAYLENDLSDYQRDIFETFLLTDKKYQDSFSMMKLTYLHAVELQYPHKDKLRKKSRAVINLRIILPFAAAAAIALLIMVRTDIFIIQPEIAAVPETEINPEIITLESVTKKPPVKGKAATIQIIRNSRGQVPVSNIKKKNIIPDKKVELAALSQQESQRISRIEIPGVRIPNLYVKEDQITTTTQPLPTINMSSLAITERVRYQLGRVSKLMDEDDVFIWNLASQGIEEINKLAGTEMSLMASQDQEGSVSGFRFKSRLLHVSAPISQDR